MIELKANGSLPGADKFFRIWLGAQNGELYLREQTTDDVDGQKACDERAECYGAFIRWVTDWQHIDDVQFTGVKETACDGLLSFRVAKLTRGNRPGYLQVWTNGSYKQSALTEQVNFDGWATETLFFMPSQDDKQSRIKRYLDNHTGGKIGSDSLRQLYVANDLPAPNQITGSLFAWQQNRLICALIEQICGENISLPPSKHH